jgi:DNA-binding LytR/AlgR family response regulator
MNLPPISDGTAPADSQPRLADRLPASTAGEILALNAEDHYVRIHTVSGSQLMLMRLSDAIAEMDGVEGLQTHRSWWVSRRAVRKLHLAGRGGRLTLQSGLQVPVARSALAQLRNSDWR